MTYVPFINRWRYSKTPNVSNVDSKSWISVRTIITTPESPTTAGHVIKNGQKIYYRSYLFFSFALDHRERYYRYYCFNNDVFSQGGTDLKSGEIMGTHVDVKNKNNKTKIVPNPTVCIVYSRRVRRRSTVVVYRFENGLQREIAETVRPLYNDIVNIYIYAVHRYDDCRICDLYTHTHTHTRRKYTILRSVLAIIIIRPTKGRRRRESYEKRVLVHACSWRIHIPRVQFTSVNTIYTPFIYKRGRIFGVLQIVLTQFYFISNCTYSLVLVLT